MHKAPATPSRKRLYVYVPPSLLVKLRQAARREGRSVSDYAARALAGVVAQGEP